VGNQIAKVNQSDLKRRTSEGDEKMKIGVKVMPRKEVLDTQGRAVENTLRSNGQLLNTCQVGRYIVLDLPETDPATALKHATAMAEFVLYNPLIETFELEQI
jgi:phosphoribosylformylglycinamidine (FGAM) synthase PurS component